MSIDNRVLFDPKDIERIKDELKKEDATLPCNIWGYIKQLEARIKVLEAAKKE